MKGDINITYILELDCNERQGLMKEIQLLNLKNDLDLKNWYLKQLLEVLESLA